MLISAYHPGDLAGPELGLAQLCVEAQTETTESLTSGDSWRGPWLCLEW
jgi:hypothetical protein